MGTVELPIVSATATILMALDRIQQASRSAVIVSSGQRQDVVLLDDLLMILRRDGDVPVARCVSYVEAMPVAARILIDIKGKVHPRTTVRIHDQSQLGRWVHTDHESIADAFAARSTLCRCVKVRTHVYKPVELLKPGKCNQHEEDVICK